MVSILSRGSWRLVLVVGLLGLLAAAVVIAAPALLYDGSVAGQTPADQGFLYLTEPWPAAAKVHYADGGTTLDSTRVISDLAGFSVRPERTEPLSRTLGFTLRFTVQVTRETHLSRHRAGLSVLLLGEDLRGIELGLWTNEVWAQNDGAALFTHGEGVALNLVARPVAFELTVLGDRYELEADGVLVLEGPLRDYTASRYPSYHMPNIIFLGDNTSRAAAVARILFVSMEAATPTPTATPTHTATPSSTPTVTPAPTSGPTEATVRVFLPLLSR